ncbi:MAG: DUF4333 domain-containing protein [Nocardioides sp.]|nr:DUF4333 domain-containing protein [Nocardioides sp.]
MKTFSRALVATAAAALLLSGCSGSVSIGGSGVESDQLAQEVSDQLETTVGQAPDDVDCPDGLDAEVGAETRCTLTDGDATYGVSVTATAVEDGEVSFDIAVDGEPQG